MEMDISIREGKCKVIYGPAKRIVHTTEQAVGLVLLGMANRTGGAPSQWQDFLQTHGIAVGQSGNKALTLYVSQAKQRTILYRVGTTGGSKLVVTIPTLLIATAFEQGRLVHSKIFVIKAGLEHKLTTTLTEPILTAFPYGNVHDDGRVCWGSASTRDIKTPMDMEEIFFGSAFNHDLFNRGTIGCSDPDLATLVSRVNGALPLPPNYSRSIGQVVQDLGR